MPSGTYLQGKHAVEAVGGVRQAGVGGPVVGDEFPRHVAQRVGPVRVGDGVAADVREHQLAAGRVEVRQDVGVVLVARHQQQVLLFVERRHRQHRTLRGRGSGRGGVVREGLRYGKHSKAY